MHWHFHGCGAFVCRTILLFVASCVPEGDELHDLPPISWRGSHIEFGSDVDEVICPATLPTENEYMEGVDEYVRSDTSYPVRYYHLHEELTYYGFGCESVYGCFRFDDEVMIVGSRLLSHRHELIHASSSSGHHRLLEEGLATFLGTDLQWFGIADPLDIRAAFESIEGNGGGLPAEFYPVAGHFVSYLVEEHGLPSVVSLIDASELALSLDELSGLSREHLGRDIPDELDDYEASGPGCEVAQYSPTWFPCELTPPSIPIFACGPERGLLTVDVTLACDDRTSGVQDGMIWRDVLIEVPEATNGLVYIYEGHPVELVVRGCGQGCSTPFARLTSETSEEHYINQSFELREGLTLVRIIKPVEAAGRVRFSVNLSCP
jgi:hypothetical protein